MTTRSRYLLALLLVFALGLPTRLLPQDQLPAFCYAYVGDALWALAIFLGLGVLFPAAQLRTRLLTALGIAYTIELTNLIQTDWLNALRQIKLLALVLGFTFQWSDVAAYTVGIGVGGIIEYVWLRRTDTHDRPASS